MLSRGLAALFVSLLLVSAVRADDNLGAALAAGAGESVVPFPPIKLRAYGTLSGTQKLVASAPQSSVLFIHCDDVAKAQLVLAKYLSDLGIFPGVTTLPLATTRGQVAARQVEGQGMVAAVRSGQDVYIFTAADGPSLGTLVGVNLPAAAKVDAGESEMNPPMYVDRWDKYGFRFYYAPFGRPHENEPWNPAQDFTFADQTGKDGLVLWNGPVHIPKADGIMNINSLEWTFRGGLKLQLPMGVNIGITDDNLSLLDRYPDGVAPDADCYLGGWYYESPGQSKTISFADMPVQEVALSQLKPLVLDLSKKYPNIVNWLEPHEEDAHGVADMVTDHGGAATSAFRDWMKVRYGTPDAVAKRWGKPPGVYRTWEDVPYPELATFFGWGPDAIDLEGQWKISFDAPYDADSAQPGLDDSSWPSVGPYHNTVLRLLPRKPAVLRRHVRVDAGWRAAHPRVYFYLFDFENTIPKAAVSTALSDVLVFINGKPIAEDPSHRVGWHWSGLNITGALKNGDNLITLCLPQAFLDYRCFLSGEDPGTYPALTKPGMNAMWVDYSDFMSFTRSNSVRRGMQMIRQVDADRPITVMSPGYYWEATKYACQDYGGVVHDTGAMAGFWTDYNPVIAKGIGLPSDCEPGGPASDLNDFKRFMGRWSTEDTQGVDYFGNLGDVAWRPDIRDYFQKTLPLWHVLGKDHTPYAEIALLDSMRVPRLYGYPWNLTDHWSTAPDLILGSGLWTFPWHAWLQNVYPRAGVTEDDFARGNVDPYRVVIDTNTTIMDPPVVNAIADWVRKGGVFITYMQTGRHTSTEPNSWPITKLTGYAVTAVEKKQRHLNLIAGQTFFHGDTPDWQPENNNQPGLTLQKQDPACVDLAQWDDGTVAVGMRKLGKGMVINLGVTVPNPLVFQLLEDLKLKHVPGTATSSDVILRHFISNNGLYDVWPIWNQQGHPTTTNVVFRDGLVPTACHDLNTGEGIPIDTSDPAGAKLTDIALDSWQTRVFVTARNQLAQAPAEWFTVQRHWWQGTADPGPDLPLYTPKLALDLTKDWSFKPLAGNTPSTDATLHDPATDDSKWPKMPLGIFDYPDNQDVQHAVFRRHFTVPAAWNKGKVLIYGKTDGPSGSGLNRWIDGQPQDSRVVLNDVGGTLTAGSTHVIGTEVWGAQPPLGTFTPTFLMYVPDPLSSQPLADGWSFASDFMSYSQPNPLPAVTPGAGSIRTEVTIDPKEQGKNVVLHVDLNNAGFRGIIFNGRWFEAYGNVYGFMDENVTPFVKFGQKNEITVVLGSQTTVQGVALNFYDKDVYP